MFSRGAWPAGLSWSVSARLVERFIFNFRLSPNSLDEKLPVPWLRPQVLNGWSIVSFCVLRVKELMLRPVPSTFGLDTVCCAYRCGVVECSDGVWSPSVYILGRNTDRKFLSLMAPVIFESAVPSINASIEHAPGSSQISVRFEDGRPLFSARVFPSKSVGELKSKAFDSLQEFVGFIKDGVSSYARSTLAGQYSRIDLYKEDEDYESMEAEVRYNKLDYDWDTAGLEYDSVVRAGGGGLCVWTFKGKVPSRLQGTSATELTA